MDEDDYPEELRDAEEESAAFLTQAKKQRAEVEKARDFFKKGQSGGDRTNREE